MPVVNMVQLVITSLLIVAVFAKDEINVEDGDCTLVGRNAKVDTQLTFTLYKDDKWETMAWPDFIKIEDKKKKPTTTFKIECKSASNTWTNKFRILDTVAVDTIDQISGGKQGTALTLTCTGNKIAPTWLFKHTDDYCSQGCPLLPDTPVHNWQHSYPTSIVSTSPNQAPILQGSAMIILSCVPTSAPKNGGKSTTTTKCTSSGYTELSSLLECVKGCTNYPTTGIGTKVNQEASKVTGDAPFNIGDVVQVSCTDPQQTIIVSEFTCLSTQMWNEPVTEVPKCFTKTSSAQCVQTLHIMLLLLLQGILLGTR